MLRRMCDILITDSFEALENEDQSTKHPNIENKEPKSRKRSTQNSKTKHPNIENDAPKTQKLENGAPKSRKQSIRNSKTKHPKLETCLQGFPLRANTRQRRVISPKKQKRMQNTKENLSSRTHMF